METSKGKAVGAITLEVKKKDIPLEWLGTEAQNKNPNGLFRVIIQEIKPALPTPKEYPENVKKIIENAKSSLKEKRIQSRTGFRRSFSSSGENCYTS